MLDVLGRQEFISFSTTSTPVGSTKRVRLSFPLRPGSPPCFFPDFSVGVYSLCAFNLGIGLGFTTADLVVQPFGGVPLP